MTDRWNAAHTKTHDRSTKMIELSEYLTEAVKTRPSKDQTLNRLRNVTTAEDLEDLLLHLGYTKYSYDKMPRVTRTDSDWNGFEEYLNAKGWTTFQIHAAGNDYVYYIWFDYEGPIREYASISNSSDKVLSSKVIDEIIGHA